MGIVNCIPHGSPASGIGRRLTWIEIRSRCLGIQRRARKAGSRCLRVQRPTLRTRSRRARQVSRDQERLPQGICCQLISGRSCDIQERLVKLSSGSRTGSIRKGTKVISKTLHFFALSPERGLSFRQTPLTDGESSGRVGCASGGVPCSNGRRRPPSTG